MKKVLMDSWWNGGAAGFPLWSKTGNQWDTYWTFLQSLVAETTQTESVTTFGSFTLNGNQWRSNVVGPDGTIIYGIPYSKTKVLRIDTSDDSTTEIGTTVGTYIGGCLAPNGKIYAMPLNATAILKIDPLTDTVSTVSGSFGTGAQKWLGCTVADNGLIYGCPYDSPNIIEFNPTTEAIRLIDISGTSSGTTKFKGAQLAPNGKIYFIANSLAHCGVFNPADDSYTTIATAGTTTVQYNGAALYGDYIYSMPLSNNSVLRINWTNDTLTETIVVPAYASKYHGTTLGANGRVYGTPWNYNSVGKMVISTEIWSALGSVPLNGTKWSGAVLAKNGSMYSAPFDSDVALKINNSELNLDVNFVCSRYVNKF